MLTKLLDLLPPDKGSLPNNFTIGMGKLIRQAREDAGMSQTALAKAIYRRQATLSAIENGKMEVEASTLSLISATLDRPITYFFPSWSIRQDDIEGLTPEEAEFVSLVHRLSKSDLKKLLAQTRALVNIAVGDETEPANELHPHRKRNKTRIA